jgi:hypothetical protein
VTEDATKSGCFDPFEAGMNRRLLTRARCIARGVGLPTDEGPAACQDLLIRILEGDSRLLQSEALFNCALRHRLQDVLRRRRRMSSLDGLLGGNDGRGSAAAETLLGLFVEDDPERSLLSRDREHAQAFARRLFASAVARLSDRRRGAFFARLRQRVESEGGRSALAEFERRFGVSLGECSGTAAFALMTGTSAGTVASDANRAEREVVGAVRSTIRENLGRHAVA